MQKENIEIETILYTILNYRKEKIEEDNQEPKKIYYIIIENEIKCYYRFGLLSLPLHGHHFRKVKNLVKVNFAKRIT